MKTQFDVKTGKFFISVRPDKDEALMHFFEDARKDMEQRGVHVPPPISSSVIEESWHRPGEDVWSVIEYEYIEFVVLFLEVLYRLLKDPDTSAMVKKQCDQIKDWRAADRDTESSTVQ